VETVQGREVPVAVGFSSRLAGLAGLRRDEVGAGLLIPRCSSVHTFGMRFALDLLFLDGHGEVLAIRRGVRPRRFASHRCAVAVLEIPAGPGGDFSEPGD
jgi:uncharacterized membrane protein (UPF0127 family)